MSRPDLSSNKPLNKHKEGKAVYRHAYIDKCANTKSDISELTMPAVESKVDSELWQKKPLPEQVYSAGTATNKVKAKLETSIAFGGLGAIVTKIAFTNASTLPLAWVGLSFAAVGVGYLFNTAKIFGKSDSGKIAVWSQAALLPYRMFALGVWHLAIRFDKQEPINKVNDQLYVGRRLIRE